MRYREFGRTARRRVRAEGPGLGVPLPARAVEQAPYAEAREAGAKLHNFFEGQHALALEMVDACLRDAIGAAVVAPIGDRHA